MILDDGVEGEGIFEIYYQGEIIQQVGEIGNEGEEDFQCFLQDDGDIWCVVFWMYMVEVFKEQVVFCYCVFQLWLVYYVVGK